jgi:putative nucleotidyltransferase with HDIG domain
VSSEFPPLPVSASHRFSAALLNIAETAFACPVHLISGPLDKLPGCPIPVWQLCQDKLTSILPWTDKLIVAIQVTDGSDARCLVCGLIEGADASPWLQRLAETTRLALQQAQTLHFQNRTMEDYAGQVTRDFEELVWTRDLAAVMAERDIRDSLATMTEAIFPTLLDTLQAQQLILIEYWQPSIEFTPPPDLSAATFRSYGTGTVSTEAVLGVVAKFAEEARSQPLVINRMPDLQCWMEDSGLREWILVPIHKQQEEFGWLVAVNRQSPNRVLNALGGSVQDPNDLEFGTYEGGLLAAAASFLASHAKNTRLLAEREQLLIQVVQALVSTIDAKDPYTRGHSTRVACIAARLARAMQLDEELCEQIYVAGLLHDIGKIGVPDAILLKAGPPTPEEFEILKQHPVVGYEVLKHLKQLAHVLTGVRHHHEAWNGSGYPEGLKAEDIPLPARIIAVADAFDAMTSDRPYRKGLAFETAMKVFHENKGPQWDSQVLQAFFRISREIFAYCREAQQLMRSSELGLGEPLREFVIDI